MRSSGHIVYLCLIALTAIATYQLTSSGESETASPGTPEPVVEQTRADATQSTPVTARTGNPVSIAPERVTDTTPYDDEALHSRVAELEAELADYQRAFDQLRDMPGRISPERNEAMRAEGRVHEWATDTELDLETLFMRDERLRNIHIEQMECFSEHCELSLSHAHLDDGFPTQYFNALLRADERLEAQHFMVMSVGNSEHTQLTLTQNPPEAEEE